jgi:hypothetical protein
MDFGRNIFTAGFADPNLWTNHVWSTDVGLNWYLNFYVKIMFDWEHVEFGFVLQLLLQVGGAKGSPVPVSRPVPLPHPVRPRRGSVARIAAVGTCTVWPRTASAARSTPRRWPESSIRTASP